MRKIYLALVLLLGITSCIAPSEAPEPTRDPDVVAPVTGLRAKSMDDEHIQIIWQRSATPGARYRVAYSVASDTARQTTAVSDTVFTAFGLQPGVIYRFTVQAFVGSTISMEDTILWSPAERYPDEPFAFALASDLDDEGPSYLAINENGVHWTDSTTNEGSVILRIHYNSIYSALSGLEFGIDSTRCHAELQGFILATLTATGSHGFFGAPLSNYFDEERDQSYIFDPTYERCFLLRWRSTDGNMRYSKIIVSNKIVHEGGLKYRMNALFEVWVQRAADCPYA